MYGRTSVRLVKIHNEMICHSAESNVKELEAPAGARSPLNRLRLDPPFLVSSHCTEASDYANDDFWLRSVLSRSLPPPQ